MTVNVTIDQAPGGGGFIYTIKCPFTILGGARTYDDAVQAMWTELDWLAQFSQRA